MFVTVEDAKLFALSFGARSNPAIVALSGWIGSWEDWADPLAILSEKWRAISYDHRGSGATIAPVESITFDRLVDDVVAVMDAFEVERCVLAAMSMGAAVAFGAALRYPHRFSGLVIVDAIDLRSASSQRQNDPFILALKEDYPRALDRFVSACVPEKESDHIKRWGRMILDRASQEAAIALYQMGDSIDLQDDLRRITQPTLILHGDADVLASVESAEWLAKTLLNAKLVVLRGGGHVPIMTRPREVADEIMSFFKS